MRIDRATLLPLLRHAAKCAEQRAENIASNVLLSATGGVLRVQATDYEVSGIGTAACDGELLACVPAKALLGVVAALPDGAMLALSLDGGRLVVEAGRSWYRLATANAAEFPALPDMTGGGVQLDPAALRQMLGRVALYVSQDDSRPTIAGALLEVGEGKLRAVATDGNRLCLDAIPFDGQMPRTILHRRALGVLLPMIDGAEACSLSLAGNNLRLDAGELTLICRKVDGNFPDYTKVIPNATGHGLQVAAETLGREVRRVSVMLRANKILRIVADSGTLRLDAADAQNGDAHAEVDIDGDLPALGLNPKFVADACAIGGTLTIEARDTESPVRITSDAAPEWVAVLMPMRLK